MYIIQLINMDDKLQYATTRARETERRLRDRYPQILREAGLDDAMIDRLMADYDDPVIRTMNPVTGIDRYPVDQDDDDKEDEISIDDFGPFPG